MGAPARGRSAGVRDHVGVSTAWGDTQCAPNPPIIDPTTTDGPDAGVTPPDSGDLCGAVWGVLHAPELVRHVLSHSEAVMGRIRVLTSGPHACDAGEVDKLRTALRT